MEVVCGAMVRRRGFVTFGGQLFPQDDERLPQNRNRGRRNQNAASGTDLDEVIIDAVVPDDLLPMETDPGVNIELPIKK